jgi:biopolymer transport protein TolR
MAMSLDPIGGGRRGKGGQRFATRAEINVTPFVDVMLVLLIVFMVAAPLLTVGEMVELPRTSSDALPSDNEPLAVIVSADGVVRIQETEIALAEVGAKLRAVAEAGGKTSDDRIYVYGDDSASYGDVLRVMATIRDAGFPNLALVTDAASQTPEAEPASQTEEQ